MPSTDVSQENNHAVLSTHSKTSICGLQLQINSSGPAIFLIET